MTSDQDNQRLIESLPTTQDLILCAVTLAIAVPIVIVATGISAVFFVWGRE